MSFYFLLAFATLINITSPINKKINIIRFSFVIKPLNIIIMINNKTKIDVIICKFFEISRFFLSEIIKLIIIDIINISKTKIIKFKISFRTIKLKFFLIIP